MPIRCHLRTLVVSYIALGVRVEREGSPKLDKLLSPRHSTYLEHQQHRTKYLKCATHSHFSVGWRSTAAFVENADLLAEPADRLLLPPAHHHEDPKDEHPVDPSQRARNALRQARAEQKRLENAECDHRSY